MGFAVPVADELIRARRQLRFIWMSGVAFRRYVRLSISYLYRIKVDGKYLLIKGRRHDQFQPVGGVFKVYPTGKARLVEWEALDDNLYAIDPLGADDLRVRIRGKYITPFSDGSMTVEERETDSWREFQEELVASGFLSPNLFQHVRADYVGTGDTGLRWGAQPQSLELIYAEVFELIPTEDQAVALRAAVGGNDRLYWASEEEIRRQGASLGQGVVKAISEHSLWIVEPKF